MAQAWTDAVRRKGELVVGADLGGAWSAVWSSALSEFNALSRRHRLGVTLRAAARSDDPHVVVEAVSGEYSCTYGGDTYTGTLTGDTMHGRTILFSYTTGIEKAFTFLPSSPLVNTPRGRRPAGPPVLKLIGIHEMVHACGLHDSEHVNDDLFQANPQVDAGTAPAQDQIRIESRRGYSWMPPFVLGAETVRRLRELW